MVEAHDIFWEKLQKYAKIYRIKAFRFWHRFDRQYRVSHTVRKSMLALGLKLILLATPNAQLSLHAQNVQKKSVPQLLAKATEAKAAPEYAHFMEEHRDMIIERQKNFAKTLWEILQENIFTIQEAEKKGQRTKTLRGLFNRYKKQGITIDPEFFCASAGLGSFLQAVDETKFEEYKLLFDCLKSPNSCSSIIDDLKESFGNKKESTDIQTALAHIFKKNPYAVCIVFPRSKQNSRSGYHYVTVFPNSVAVDTALSEKDSLHGKTARFNRTTISNTEEYFINTYNKGYVFDVTEMIGNYQVFQMFMEYLEEKHTKLINKVKDLPVPASTLLLGPVSSLPKPREVPTDFSWAAVSRKRFEQKDLFKKRNEHLI